MKKRIAIYIDDGASHSFIWLVELLDKKGLLQIIFVNSEDIANGALNKIDIFIISGGDSFAIAGCLGPTGASAIKSFIEKGGTFAGICAGAYLMLRSSKEPLHYFNMTSGKITNLSTVLPEAKALEYKYSINYGCSYIYHPVRGELSLKLCSYGPFQKECLLKAPIYGGPFIRNDGSIIPLSYFEDFTDKTLFLIDRETALSACEGSILSGYQKAGKGVMYFFSTHMEHPDYPEANDIFLKLITGETDDFHPVDINTGKKKEDAKKKINAPYGQFKKTLSHIRMISIGLEKIPFFWKVGGKIWETEKIRFFTDSLLKMEKKYGKILTQAIEDASINKLVNISNQSLLLLKKIHESLLLGNPAQKEAELFISHIRELYSLYCTYCFKCINTEK